MTAHTEAPDHYEGCHPEDDQAPATLTDEKPTGGPEPCWHCGTETPRGCWCPRCVEREEVLSCDNSYDCPQCHRWWGYLTITTLEIGAS